MQITHEALFFSTNRCPCCLLGADITVQDELQILTTLNV